MQAGVPRWMGAQEWDLCGDQGPPERAAAPASVALPNRRDVSCRVVCGHPLEPCADVAFTELSNQGLPYSREQEFRVLHALAQPDRRLPERKRRIRVHRHEPLARVVWRLRIGRPGQGLHRDTGCCGSRMRWWRVHHLQLRARLFPLAGRDGVPEEGATSKAAPRCTPQVPLLACGIEQSGRKTLSSIFSIRLFSGPRVHSSFCRPFVPRGQLCCTLDVPYICPVGQPSKRSMSCGFVALCWNSAQPVFASARR